MTSDEREQYAREVVAELEKRLGHDYWVTSADWCVLLRWMDQDIPLAIVLRGLALCKTPKSICYIQPAVDQEIRQWNKAMFA